MIEGLRGVEIGIKEILRQGARRLVQQAMKAKLTALLTVEKLQKDRNVLLIFYDFPAEHWLHHIHSSHVIESTFAAVCQRSSFPGLSFTNKIASAPQQDAA